MAPDDQNRDRPSDSSTGIAEAPGLLPSRIGKYRVVRQLGYGAFADVYLAQHEHTHLQVALKVLRSQLDPRLAEQVRLRFLAEERIARTIDDRRVVQIYETSAGEGNGPCFIAMEYVDGKPFCTALRSFEPLTDSERQLLLARLGLEIAQAVARAHERGIVHRDLKPDNVLVTRGTRPDLKILDFGIAKAPMSLLASLPRPAPGALPAQQVTELGTVMGSRPYMAPEQNGAAHTVTGKADVYALGVMLAISAAGLDADALENSGTSWVLQEDVERVLEARPLAPDFANLLRRMLEMEPELRPDMAEVALELQRRARTERGFAAAVYDFRKHNLLPKRKQLTRVLREVEHETQFTDDELEFLRVAPARALARSGVRPLPWLLASTCAVAAVAFGVSYVRERQQAQAQAAQLRMHGAQTSRSAADQGTATHPAEASQTRPVPDRAHPDLRAASANLAKQGDKEALRNAVTSREESERPSAACRVSPEQLAECSDRRRSAERQAADCANRNQDLTQSLESQRRELDSHTQAEGQCRRELDTRIAQLAECTSRVRLCSESLRATNSVRPNSPDPDGSIE